MILTYKIRHNRDFSRELQQAFAIAEFVVANPWCRSSKDVKSFGLKSAISNQILRKYGNQRKIRRVHRVNLTVPGQSIKVDAKTKTIRVVPLDLNLNYQFPDFKKVNQIEIDHVFAYISCMVEEEPEMIPHSFIGIDRNATGHIAVASHPETGKVWKLGKSAHHVHQKYANIRRRLQRDQEFKHLKKVKNRESRIVRNINHEVSKRIVQIACKLNSGIVLEDLGGIRNTGKSGRSFRYSLNSWSFYQLGKFIEYKAKLHGVPVYYVDPAYTSQECSVCGHIGTRNRKEFACPACGHVDHADANASFNIALRQQRMVNCTQTEMCTMGALIPPVSSGMEDTDSRTPRL